VNYAVEMGSDAMAYYQVSDIRKFMEGDVQKHSQLGHLISLL
jgi:phenylalanyl-tRNA synthetase alpha subunit